MLFAFSKGLFRLKGGASWEAFATDECFPIPAIPAITCDSGDPSVFMEGDENACMNTAGYLPTRWKFTALKKRRTSGRKPRAYKRSTSTKNRIPGLRQFPSSPNLRSPVKQKLTIKKRNKSATFRPVGMEICDVSLGYSPLLTATAVPANAPALIPPRRPLLDQHVQPASRNNNQAPGLGRTRQN